MSRSMRIKGPSRIRGELSIPGDKSISHRVALLASIAEGASRITGFSSSADCQATLDCIKRLGIKVEQGASELIVHGNGLFGFAPGSNPVLLQAGNSGTTIRMLSGLLAAQQFESEVDGDASLRTRPMARIIEPLTLMGAQIDAANGSRAPLHIQGRKLKGISYASPVASAQVKSCVLMAGLLADGSTSFSEPTLSRNHTELMLNEFGARVERDAVNAWSVEGGAKLSPVNYKVPGDVSSAAFFIAAAVALRDSSVVLRGVGLNPTRTAFLDVLSSLGANIARCNLDKRHGEAAGDICASTSELRAESGKMTLSGGVIANLIDEIPILAVLATQVEGTIEVRDARELRIKESDRIRTLVNGIRSMSGEIEEFEDGFGISGPQKLTGARVESAGDHRIAMAFAVAGLLAEGSTEILDADCAAVSFPSFYEALASMAGPGVVEGPSL
ncbi:MAG TPA: 3-phosphoshikimate 1-carboxyvinyltransferase [Blastocatellia bacterium]|nr:3-phosphoshikimate 1-carboxyvinyltransferase [Blastocatellia bacterium]